MFKLLLDDAATQDGVISSERLVFETRDGNERIVIDNLLGNTRTAMWIYTILTR